MHNLNPISPLGNTKPLSESLAYILSQKLPPIRWRHLLYEKELKVMQGKSLSSLYRVHFQILCRLILAKFLHFG